MDVDVMNELMYDTLVRYFKTLAHTGYKSYDVVFKMLVIDFIYEITHTELRYYITNKDIKLMQDLLYQFLGSTCEISFPTNNRPCCVCICCNGGNSTPPPSNTVYYGVIKGYMDPNSFCSIPINELIDRSETKFKPIIGDSVNEFTIPQDGYFSYLIIPIDKVELQYAAFTSGGLTSTYYDSSKPNTPTALDPTPNGAYYSKYTRGGTAPYNKGGSYKGIDYDVYFAYINSGSIPEMINIKAKNK